MDDLQDQGSPEVVPEVVPDEVEKTSETQPKRYFPIIIVGVAMLAIGLVLGYIGRGTYGPEAAASKATGEAVAAAIQTRASTNKEVMTMLIGATKHFKGDANAPVTIIEFSDFQ